MFVWAPDRVVTYPYWGMLPAPGETQSREPRYEQMQQMEKYVMQQMEKDAMRILMEKTRIEPATRALTWLEPPDQNDPPVGPSPVVHEIRGIQLGEDFFTVEDFFAVNPMDNEKLVGTEADPRSFQDLKLWGDHVRDRLLVELRIEVSMEQILAAPPGGDICICGDRRCRIGPFTIA